MIETPRQPRHETSALHSSMATIAFIQIGTSVALTNPQQDSAARPDYRFEAAVSPEVQRLDHEVMGLRGYLRSHGALAGAPEMAEVQVDRAHVSRATAAASAMSDMTFSADDFDAVMAARTRFPRLSDVDDEE